MLPWPMIQHQRAPTAVDAVPYLDVTHLHRPVGAGGRFSERQRARAHADGNQRQSDRMLFILSSGWRIIFHTTWVGRPIPPPQSPPRYCAVRARAHRLPQPQTRAVRAAYPTSPDRATVTPWPAGGRPRTASPGVTQHHQPDARAPSTVGQQRNLRRQAIARTLVRAGHHETAVVPCCRKGDDRSGRLRRRLAAQVHLWPDTATNTDREAVDTLQARPLARLGRIERVAPLRNVLRRAHRPGQQTIARVDPIQPVPIVNARRLCAFDKETRQSFAGRTPVALPPQVPH